MSPAGGQGRWFYPREFSDQESTMTASVSVSMSAAEKAALDVARRTRVTSFISPQDSENLGEPVG